MSDVSQAHRPEHLESARMEEAEDSPYIKKVEEKFVHIKEEQEEFLIRLQDPHIKEQQQPHPLKKEEEDPPYVKVEVVDIPKWTVEPLKGEDGGPSDASRGAELSNGSSSSSKEGSQADNLIARPSDCDDFTSHSLFYLYVSQAHYPEHPESACIKDEEEEAPSIKEEFIHIKVHQLWSKKDSGQVEAVVGPYKLHDSSFRSLHGNNWLADEIVKPDKYWPILIDPMGNEEQYEWKFSGI
ncbi:uncharacterized protein LOC130928046 isoform X4 [Corythoichthys intestinalis]|uniref:uncharacterized protein LOC130928046 isoform X4 n=1 Tax=Corythoichthys intestinalis TaxID=161448 RepID=UPI0025A528D2|nr:uncharacterized protein LOC130928046 isoform X4 [Corythoichthys intestinalis]